MQLRIFIYNSGLDRFPTDQKNITAKTFDSIATTPNLRMKSVGSRTDVCGADKFVRNYNQIINKKLIEHFELNKVDIVVFQEFCPSFINSYNFDKYVASCYRFYNRSSCTKTLLTGIYGDVKLEIPNFIGATTNDKVTTQYPHNFFQIVKANDLYIINLHNRIFSDPDIVRNKNYWYYLMGLILKTLGSNVIICGDNNSASLPDDPIDDNQYETIINNFVHAIRTPSQINLSDVLIVFRVVLSLASIKKYDLKQIYDTSQLECKRRPFNINDVVYYGLCADCEIQIDIDEDLCDFSLTTSSHLPYTFRVTIPSNDRPIDNRLKTMIPIADELLKLGSETEFSIVKKGGSGYQNKYYKYKTKYLALKREFDK
jgi:hypothetical protein